MADPEQICIIGAGPGGLATLKCILDTPQYKAGLWKPLVFEARDNVGGVWLPDPHPSAPHPLTPLYDSLTTNLPHPIMCFPSLPFPPATPVFPPASHVQKYLESYAAHFGLWPFIRLNTAVSDVRRDFSPPCALGETMDFDFVIVANGHHSVPRYPAVPGLDAWLAAGKAQHALWYRRPPPHADLRTKTVLVVGGGPSGGDISTELRPLCRSLIRSVTSADPADTNTHGRTTHFGDPDRGEVHFADGSVARGVDYCVLATGYQVAVPFLPDALVQSGLPPRAPPLPDVLRNSTHHLFPLAEHVFPVPAGWGAELTTSLAFVGLPLRLGPPVLEARAAAIAHPDALDVDAARSGVLARYAALGGDADPAGVARAWSLFGGEEQFEHTDRMHALAGRPEVRVPQWRRYMYEHKVVLQSFWEELERRGEARKWVAGVGEGGGFGEWVDLLQRLLEAAREWTATEA